MSAQSPARRGISRRIRARLRDARAWYESSLTAHVVGYIVVLCVVLVGAVGFLLVNRIENSIFDRAVTVKVDEFTSAWQRAQGQVAAANAPAASELQQLVNELVATQTSSGDDVVGSAVLRSATQEAATSFEIAEPSSQTAVKIRTLVSDAMRAAVTQDSNVHWQSVNLEEADGTSTPGILVGAKLVLPSAGVHEFYVAYTLDNEQYTLSSIVRVLSLGSIVLILVITVVVGVVLHLVVRPIRETARAASVLAEGGFDTRVKVRGHDDLARLGRSFNRMASSLDEQFTQLERMSKVQQEFVSAVSHELRSPVTTIRMAGQLIYDKREELTPALRRSAELQHDQLINLDVMLSDLLEISRYDAGAMTVASTSADLAGIVAEAVKAQEPLAEANGVEVVIEATGDTSAKVEPRRIQRIVRNLVVNALEHADGKPVRIRTVGGDDAVAVEVSDRGVGLTPEQASHVFDRFWRADSSRVRKSGGTGLGLTIAREDALLHGGRLQCTGELGVGATFLLVVPRELGEPYTSPLDLKVAAATETWGHAVEEDDDAEAPVDATAETDGGVL